MSFPIFAIMYLTFDPETDESFAYLVQYYNAAIQRIRKKTSVIPIMLSDGFSGPQTWDQWFANSTANIVFDTHIYLYVTSIRTRSASSSH